MKTSEKDLFSYRVTYKACPEEKFTFVFDCWAEDAEHAYEQAENAEPGAVLLTATRLSDSPFNAKDEINMIIAGVKPPLVVKDKHPQKEAFFDEFEKSFSRHDSEILSFLDGVDSPENIVNLATVNEFKNLQEKNIKKYQI